MTAVGQGLDFGLLGPLVVRRAGAVLDPGRRRQRLLLIRLLLADGRAVAPRTLCEELWPQQPGRTPGGALNSLHAHVSKLRAVLEPQHLRGDAAFELLVTEPLGYALRVPPESRDTVRFERSLARARLFMDQGRSDRVVEEARNALELWRGTAFADAAHHLFATQETARLEELRQTAREIRTTALLMQGRITEALDAAQELTAAHPLRETGWALLLRALYLAGRHPEALQRYTELRRHLADELGLEPGPPLRALHQGILHHDLPPLHSAGQLNGVGAASASGGCTEQGREPTGPARSGGRDEGEPGAPADQAAGDAADRSAARPAPAAEEEATPAPLAPPAQLPGSLPVFAGRAAEGAWLSAVSGAPDRPGPTAASVVVISGTPGVGKTTFAVHHAHRVASSFPDGQLFVNLCGFHPHAPAVDPGAALHGFLTALGVPAQRIPEDTPARSTLFRSLLADRRIILVLDNARDEQQVRPLLPAGAGCLTLVTSRNRLPGLITTDGAKPLILPLPSQTEAHQALERRLGSERLAAEPAATTEIIRLCGRLPLALAVVAARAELEPSFPLHAIVDDLRHTPGDLDAFTGFDSSTDVRAVFSWSYRSLDEDAARLFRFLALHPGPHITAPAAAGLVGLPLARTRRALAVLTGSCLLEQPLPGRYSLHDLLRAYAGELTQIHDTAQERHDATLRVLDHYMFTAYAANQLLKQDTTAELDLGVPGPGVTPEKFTGAQQATRWFTAEHRVLAGLLHCAVSQELDHHTTGLAWSLKEHLQRQEFWPEAITALTPALEVARRQGNRLEEGRCLRHLGSIHAYLGHQEEALQHLRRATAIFEQLDATGDQARAHYVMACALFLFGRIQEAVTFSERGLELSRATGEELWLAECLLELAWFHCNLGQLEKSLQYSEEGIALFQRLDAPWQLAQGWDIVGHILRALGRHEESVATYQRATRAFEELGDHRNAIGTLMRLGDTRLVQGDREGARADWVKALENADERGMRHSAQQVRDRLTALDMDADPLPAVPERAAGSHRLPVPHSGGPAHQDPGRHRTGQQDAAKP
ncbi:MULTISPECIES: AfsR/SARP family transcriptional regulator [unclassified Streptomyces]|uniref:AfsR/SARP family transcriptional regulator n=1 Tax=unclassified Streptomyces TaxID=2593676 RepID=UPI002E77AC00|nr:MULTISPECIES: BTAD domain-containing putative transcriptional regulator [unclassified Streptomyces]MEE1763970.1 BTAD domain-containing putative transcriptional regulator [Streptomyces sp. SP18BB07]MEE1831970.1 BTAD domain-containing putative transcriptional regulator [Streptomyces sp. SP17KL33]